MRVEVDREVATKMLNVYVIQEGMSGGVSTVRIWQPLDGPQEWVEVAPGASAPVSLRLPEEVYAALLAAGSDIPLPTRAQHDHLADTIAVRDRLLTLVEAGYNSAVPSGSFFGSRE